MSEADAMALRFDTAFRLSFATVSPGASAGPVLSPAVSLSKDEVTSIGNTSDNHDSIASIKLACFWKRIGKNQFCLPDGSVIRSATTLGDYYAAAEPQYTDALRDLATRANGPAYTICYKETVKVPNDKKAGDVPLDLALHTFETKAADFDKFPEATAQDPNAIASASDGLGSRPGQMSTDDWNEVLVVNGLLNGFSVNKATNTIRRARRTAFKLEPNPVHPLLFSPGTVSSSELDSLRKLAKASIVGSPARNLERGLARVLSQHKLALQDSSDSKADVPSNDDPPPPPLDHLYPLWEVCDDSGVKIETISSTMQLASARQGFSSEAVESALSTSVFAVAFNASAGFSTSSNTGQSGETGTKSDQMHATYEFPRVRLYLDEEAVSLSADCAAAIQQIQSTKSIDALQAFYRDYGSLFVTQVKLGGRLRATRFLTAEESQNRTSAQNAWKASLAASFSALTTSGSMKGSTENATSSENQSASSASSEAVCWEAHGGNTTLANNPSLWCTTVEKFWFWRVVDQEIVLPIEDVISRLPGFESTRSIFAAISLAAQSQVPRLDTPWNGAAGAELGRGVSSTAEIHEPGDILRRTLLKANDVKKTAISAESSGQWSFIDNNRALYQFLTDAFGQAIDQVVGTRLFPDMVWRLAVTDRAFSVVLRLKRGLERATASFSAAGPDASPVAKDEADWQREYGDRYIASVVTGTVSTVVWTFLPSTPKPDQFQTKNTLAEFFSTSSTTIEAGCSYLERFAQSIPCEVYMYDAYYKETKLSASTALSSIASTHINDVKQVLAVELRPYSDLPPAVLRSMGTVPPPAAPAVSPANLATVRKDHVDYAFQAIKRRPDVTPIDASSTMLPTWSTDFSSEMYRGDLANPGASPGTYKAASGLAKGYNALYDGKNASVESCARDWNAKFGDEGAAERLLRWLRKSRQQEATQLSSPKQAGTTVFGFKTEPAVPDGDRVPDPAFGGEIKLYSIRDELKHIGLENLLATGGGDAKSLDGMWSYVLSDDNRKNMTFQQPARVVAYELTSVSWDGKGDAPPLSSDVSKPQPRVGQQIKEFAQNRKDTKTKDWALSNLWLAFAPFKESEVLGLEDIPWQ